MERRTELEQWAVGFYCEKRERDRENRKQSGMSQRGCDDDYFELSADLSACFASSQVQGDLLVIKPIKIWTLPVSGQISLPLFYALITEKKADQQAHSAAPSAALQAYRSAAFEKNRENVCKSLSVFDPIL